MDEQRELGRMLLDLSALEQAAQQREMMLEGADFARRSLFGVADVALRLGVSARFDGLRYEVRMVAEGRVQMECDRCVRLFWFPLAFSEVLTVRRGERWALEGDDWEVPYAVEELDVMPYVEDSLYLALPMRRYHGMEGTREEECDAEMLSYIKTETQDGERGLDAVSLRRLASLREKMGNLQ